MAVVVFRGPSGRKRAPYNIYEIQMKPYPGNELIS